MKRWDQRRLLAVLAVIMLSASVLTAVFFTSQEGVHDCSGEHCQVCGCLKTCERILTQGGGVLKLAVFLPAVLSVFFVLACAAARGAAKTPVSEKVRLNN